VAIHRLGYVSQDRMFQEVQVWHGKSLTIDEGSLTGRG